MKLELGWSQSEPRSMTDLDSNSSQSISLHQQWLHNQKLHLLLSSFYLWQIKIKVNVFQFFCFVSTWTHSSFVPCNLTHQFYASNSLILEYLKIASMIIFNFLNLITVSRILSVVIQSFRTIMLRLLAPIQEWSVMNSQYCVNFIRPLAIRRGFSCEEAAPADRVRSGKKSAHICPTDVIDGMVQKRYPRTNQIKAHKDTSFSRPFQFARVCYHSKERKKERKTILSVHSEAHTKLT